MLSCASVPRYRTVKRRKPAARRRIALPVLSADNRQIAISSAHHCVAARPLDVATDELLLGAAIRREKNETIEGHPRISLWLLGLYAITLFIAAFYVGRYSGHFSGDSLDPSLIARDVIAAQVVPQPIAGQSAVESAPPADGQPSLIHVTIQNMQFSPAHLEIRKGDVIEWTNADLTPHTATFAAFDSGSIDADKSWRRTFTDAGEFPYFCTFHPDMKATVLVR